MADEMAGGTADRSAGGTAGGAESRATTDLERRNEGDPYGLELAGTDVVQSDLVGIAELSSEYSADHAIQDTDAEPQDALDAWAAARDDYDEDRAARS